MTRSEERAQRMSELAALGRLMADPAGRRWLYNHLASLHVYSTSFAANALVMARNEGERNAGLQLVLEATQANPDMYLQMLKEGTNERRPSGAAGGTDPGFTDPDTDSDTDPTTG